MTILHATDQDIRELIDMAGYGIGYWASRSVVHAGPGDESASDAYVITEDETDRVFPLSFDALRVAWQTIIDGGGDVGKRIRDFLNTGEMSDVDSDAADCVVQVACFGKVIYG